MQPEKTLWLTYQKRAEKYERHEIHVRHVGTTIVVTGLIFLSLALFPLITRQHYRRPRFARSASAKTRKSVTLQ